MAKHPELEVGVLSSTREDGGNPFDTIVQHNVHVTQLVNWKMQLNTPEYAKKIKKQAKDAGIRLNSIWTGYSGECKWGIVEGPSYIGIVPKKFRKQRVKDLLAGAEFAARCGVTATATHAGFIPNDPMDPNYAGIVDALGTVAGRCKELGLGFWFETGQETPIALLRLIEDIGLDNLGINFDPANLILDGNGNPVDAVGIFGKYIRNMHAKDGLYPTTGRGHGLEVPVGTGMANFPKLLPALYAAGYRGDLIIEREIEGDQQIKDIKKTITYLNRQVARLLKKADK